MNEYWLVLKYKMSGLKLLAEIAAMSTDVKEKILSDWFVDYEENDDPICRKITQCAKDGICLNKPIQETIDDMIRLIPEDERLPNIVIKAVLSGRSPDDNANIVAESILKEWRGKS